MFKVLIIQLSKLFLLDSKLHLLAVTAFRVQGSPCFYKSSEWNRNDQGKITLRLFVLWTKKLTLNQVERGYKRFSYLIRGNILN